MVHFTSYCFVKFLSNKAAICRGFIDLKGAIDRANKDVIMEKLVLKGVKGKYSGWVKDYFYDCTPQDWFQGSFSSVEPLELGTPKDDVLSPMLFNALMDKSALWPHPQGCWVILYADDIWVQYNPSNLLNLTLEQLSFLCDQMNVVINDTKTTCQVNCRACYSPSRVNNVPLPRLPTHKYLGVQFRFANSLHAVAYVRNVSGTRLAPLKILVNRGLGVGLLVLGMFYVAVARSLIDYAAPVLDQFSASYLRPLETIK